MFGLIFFRSCHVVIFAEDHNEHYEPITNKKDNISFIATWHPFRLKDFRNPPHRFAKFSTTTPSMSTFKEHIRN